jgi:hypothetical protein
VWMFGREVEVANRAVETREFVFYRDEASGSDLDLGTQAWSCDHTAIGARCCLRATLAPGERIVVRLARCRHHGASGGNAAMVSDRGSGLRKSAWIALRRHVCDWRDRYLSRLGQLAPEGTAFTAPYVAPGSRSVPNTPYTPEPRRAS